MCDFEETAEKFENQDISSENGKTKRGPRTIPDDFLLESREHWRSFFEECWPDIGFLLLGIRNKRSSTIEDIQTAFRPVQGRPHCQLADVFLRGSPRQTNLGDLRAARIRNSDLHYRIQEMRSKRQDLQLSHAEAQRAVEDASSEDAERVQTAVAQRKKCLDELESDLKTAESDLISSDQSSCEQGVYWYCSQLLDFLHSRRSAKSASARYSLNPLNLGNALAGLDDIRWRQSFNRCSKMTPGFFVRQPYAIFLVTTRTWDRRPEEFSQAPIDFFRVEILKLADAERKKLARKKRYDSTPDFLLECWRDFRLAVEECWNPKQQDALIPYALSSAFLRKRQCQKNPLDRVLDAQERLSLS